MKELEVPYIEEDRRKRFNLSLQYLEHKIETAGDLDYCITRLCINFIKTMGELDLKT